VAAFALVGFYRGWWREGITTVFLALLTLMLAKPEFAEWVVELVNTILKVVTGLVEASTSDADISTAVASAESPITIDPESYQVYIIVLIALVLASYLIGKIAVGGNRATALGRLFGILLGGFNGYLVISLLREYLIGRYLPGQIGAAGEATAAAPATMSIQLTDMPTTSITDGIGPWLIIAAGVAILIIMLATTWEFGGLKLPTRKPPPGYAN
jgi:hypothetical protein